MSYHVLSCHVNVTSRPLTSCHVFSRLVIYVRSCHVMSCHVMSCHVIFLASLLNSSIMAAGWPRRGFRNRGPVRESGSERRSRCGAARTASIFCDLGIVFAWQGCGDRACCERVRGASCAFFATWASFRVAGCGDRACWRCAAGMPRALCRGDWVPGVSPHAHDFTRCDLRFAWQVWEFGCIDGLGKALDGGSAWQAQ